jgi:hypothetical protein
MRARSHRQAVVEGEGQRSQGQMQRWQMRLGGVLCDEKVGIIVPLGQRVPPEECVGREDKNRFVFLVFCGN